MARNKLMKYSRFIGGMLLGISAGSYFRGYFKEACVISLFSALLLYIIASIYESSSK